MGLAASALCLATAMFFEARDQGATGMIAVAEVVINRAEDTRWPDDICKVVNQHHQFSYTHDGLSNNPDSYHEVLDQIAWADAKFIAPLVLSGKVSIGLEADHYHANYVSPYWVPRFVFEKQIGDHLFYTSN